MTPRLADIGVLGFQRDVADGGDVDPATGRLLTIAEMQRALRIIRQTPERLDDRNDSVGAGEAERVWPTRTTRTTGNRTPMQRVPIRRAPILVGLTTGTVVTHPLGKPPTVRVTATVTIDKPTPRSGPRRCGGSGGCLGWTGRAHGRKKTAMRIGCPIRR